MTRKLLLMAAAFLLLGAPAFGGVLTLTFGPSPEIGSPGDILIFQGTITSSVDDYCCLNGLSVTFDPPVGTYLSADPSLFYSDVPGILFASNGDTYTGPIFEVSIAPDAPAGLYSGTATILGGDGDFGAFNPLVSQSFQVEVTPEPGMLGLTLAGLATLAALARRQQNR